MNTVESLKHPSEMSDREIRRETEERMSAAVAHVISHSEADCEAYRASLLRLTELRREARRRAALN